MKDQSIGLAEAVRALRDELTTAAANAEEAKLLFALGPIEMEFTIVGTREGGSDGKVKFAIFGVGADIGASGKIATKQTHKVKLTLTPTLRSGGPDKAIPKVEIVRGDDPIKVREPLLIYVEKGA